MTSLNVGNNGIPIENMNEIIAIVEAKPAMKVLCGVSFRDKTITELDISGRSLGVEGAVVIRRYLENNGALTSLDISNNSIGPSYKNNYSTAGVEAIASTIKENVSAVQLVLF